MCTISLKVNEKRLRKLYPELNNTDAIQSWVQKEIDKRIDDLESKVTMGIEDARTMVHQTIRHEYSIL